jgi:hypothetical protein
MKPAAVLATFSHFELVRTRKVARFLFEVPIEKADEALAALGGLPRSDMERWCGIALIESGAILSRPQTEPVPDASSAVVATADKPGKPKRAMSRAQVAGMLCHDPRFREWVEQKAGWRGNEPMKEPTAAQWVRQQCGCEMSRAEIDTDPEIALEWDSLHAQYLYDTGQMAEMRP